MHGDSLVSDEELEALRPIDEILDQLLDQSIGLARFVEDLEEINHNQVGSETEPAKPSGEAHDGGPDDAELRMVARFAPRSDVSMARNLVELLLLFGIIVGVEFAVTGRCGSFGVHPHPYWILVIPMAASRGIAGGLLAAAMATVLLAISAFQELGLQRVTDLLTYETMREPMLFGFVAFFIGQFRDEIATRYRALWRRFMHLQEATEHIVEHNAILSRANDGFKARLLDHSVQFGNLIDIAHRQERASAQEIFDLTLGMIEEHCTASVCSVLLPGDAADETMGFSLAAHRGWDEEFLRQKLNASVASEIVRTAVEQGIRINGLDPDAVPPGLGPLMVAPLFDESLAVCALICLDQLPADRLSSTTASVFFSIADWAEAGLRQASSVQLAAFDELPLMGGLQPWLGGPDDLGRQIRIEDARCTRLGLVSSILGIQATSAIGASADAYASLDRLIFSTLGALVRNTDTLYRFGYPGCYAILLAGTGQTGAGISGERIEKWLSRSLGGELAEFTVTVFRQSEDVPNLAALVTVMADAFRAQSSIPLDHRCPVAIPERGRVGGPHNFLRTLRQEMGLALRHRFKLFLVYLTVACGEHMDLRAIPGHLEQWVDSNLRGTDSAFQLASHRFVIVLPGSRTTKAFACAAALTDALRLHLPANVGESLQSEVLVAHGANEELIHLIRQLLPDESTTESGPETGF